MALSVRDVALRCLGITGPMSINRRVYGYIFRDTGGSLFGSLQPGDILPGSGAGLRLQTTMVFSTRIARRRTEPMRPDPA